MARLTSARNPSLPQRYAEAKADLRRVLQLQPRDMYMVSLALRYHQSFRRLSLRHHQSFCRLSLRYHQSFCRLFLRYRPSFRRLSLWCHPSKAIPATCTRCIFYGVARNQRDERQAGLAVLMISLVWQRPYAVRLSLRCHPSKALTHPKHSLRRLSVWYRPSKALDPTRSRRFTAVYTAASPASLPPSQRRVILL